MKTRCGKENAAELGFSSLSLSCFAGIAIFDEITDRLNGLQAASYFVTVSKVCMPAS